MSDEIKDRLKIARKFADLTQTQLAEKLKGLITQQSLSQLETGEVKGSVYIVEIAMACNVNPIWLATGIGEMTESKKYASPGSVEQKVLAVMEPMTEYEKVQYLRIGHSLHQPTQEPNGKHSSQ